MTLALSYGHILGYFFFLNNISLRKDEILAKTKTAPYKIKPVLGGMWRYRSPAMIMVKKTPVTSKIMAIGLGFSNILMRAKQLQKQDIARNKYARSEKKKASITLATKKNNPMAQ